ncbi:MAG: alpha/beta hydrolase [Spirochaetaceae bacterium]
MIKEYFQMDLNGCRQWISITGNTDKPVLLLLHGGPGTPSMNLFRMWNKPLLRDFLVITWDQRGTGRSNIKTLDPNTLTIDQLVSDTNQLTLYLKERFNREKIYLMGHSFGATLGLKTVAKYSKNYEAYFGISQFVNTTENEKSCYNWVKAEAERRNDSSALKLLNIIGEPVEGFYINGLKDTMKVKQLVGKYKGDSVGKSSTITVLLNLLFCKEYRGRYLKASISGISLSLNKLGNDLKGIDFQTQVKELEVPVYFFSGDYDQLTPQHLLRDYYKQLIAPKKELFIFKNSAHSPLWEESEKFHDIVHNIMTVKN